MARTDKDTYYVCSEVYFGDGNQCTVTAEKESDVDGIVTEDTLQRWRDEILDFAKEEAKKKPWGFLSSERACDDGAVVLTFFHKLDKGESDESSSQ